MNFNINNGSIFSTLINKGYSMKIEQRKFRIGTLAEKLEVERFVVRFWEKEFNIKSHRSSGKQRFYTEKDFERFSMIKELLYDKGFTIAGAKKFLKKGP